ncbi:Zinc finger and BTB domain-containing protein 7A [Orchesella cincta]|uniref:Zinc finger and BTB domain-containing protein 7A n=1 Tax=Orchesella cincta TaxID=48709 RepID=A0A1D2NCU6_ORCCI|nr:Zinc finger and BTB domain-containing protein 7A [Orchesella cincta]
MSKLYLVDCEKFQLQLVNSRSRRSAAAKFVGRKKFQVFYNTKTDRLPSSHLDLWKATQAVMQENYEKNRDQMAAMFGQWITVFFTISGSNPSNLKVDVEGWYLQKLVANFGQPLKLDLSLTLGGWKADAEGSLTKTTISGNEYANQRGECRFKTVSDIAFPCNFQYNLTLEGRMTIEINPADNIVFGPSTDHLAILKGMYEEKAFCDFNILSENGTEIPCHRTVLSANSPTFARILVTDCMETKVNAYKLDLSEEGVDALLKYVYFRNLDDPLASCHIAFELMDIAHQYDFIGLEDAIKQIFLGKSYLWYSINVAVDIYLYTLKLQDEQLKSEIVKVIKMKIDELEDSEVFQLLREEENKTAIDLMELCDSN